MKPQYLLILASIALFVSSTFAAGTEKSKRKKYRIVKIYGRKLKPTWSPPVESSILTPDMSESRVTNSTTLNTNGREMLRANRDKILNVGEMSLDNFDINKILAAAGHGGDSAVPTIVQFSAPSSNSHLDPEYLSKLISEQLGHNAEYTVLPSVGGEGGYGFPPKTDHRRERESYSIPSSSPKPVYSAQVSSFNKYSTTPPSQRVEYTYPTQVVKTHYTGRTVTPVREFSGTLESSHSAPISSSQNSYSAPISSQNSYSAPISSQNSYSAPISSQSSYSAPISSQNSYSAPISSQNSYSAPISSSQNSYSAPKEIPAMYSYTKYKSDHSATQSQNYRQPPAKEYSSPVSGYSQPSREYSTMKPYLFSSPAPNYESVSVSSAKKYPYQPPSPHSKIQGYSPPSITTPASYALPSKEYSLPAKVQSSSSNSKGATSQYSSNNNKGSSASSYSQPSSFSSGSYASPSKGYSTSPPPKEYSNSNGYKASDSYVSVPSQESSQANSGYSTLGREMTAPGLALAPKGEYGVSDSNAPLSYSAPNDSESKSKYATSFVRGYTSNGESNSNNYKAEAYSAPKPSTPEKWRSVEPTATYVSPPDNYQSPKAASSNGNGYFWTKGSSATYDLPNKTPPKSYTVMESTQSYTPPKFSNGEFNSYDSPQSSPYQSNEGSNQYSGQYHPSNDNTTPETYEPYSPPKSQSSDYGPPPVPNPTYEPKVEEKRPVLSKTIYVNLPAEPTTPKPYRGPPVLPQRHYKIVFIKAPTAAPQEEPEIETTPAPESKTLIYVLHKKPEKPPKIVIPTAAPTPPSKPEVHFIQYKDATTTTRTNSYDSIPDEFSDEYGIPSSYTSSDDGEFGYKSSYNRGSPLGHSDVHYDLSSSSSTIHVNMKKSISDRN